MSGWKTKTAALGPMLLGLGMVIVGITEFIEGEPLGSQKIKEGIAYFSTGLGAIGIGHKIEKLKGD